MHWKHADNPRLRDLAQWNAYECFPEADDVWDSQYDELSLCFGSMGVTIHLGVFDGEADTAYMHGVCILMAWALADEMSFTDPKFFVITSTKEGEEWGGHVALMLDENTIVDFRGVRPVSQVLKEYPVVSTDILDRKALVTQHAQEEYQENPMDYLEELEQLVTYDFAKRIAQKAKAQMKAAA